MVANRNAIFPTISAEPTSIERVRHYSLERTPANSFLRPSSGNLGLDLAIIENNPHPPSSPSSPHTTPLSPPPSQQRRQLLNNTGGGGELFPPIVANETGFMKFEPWSHKSNGRFYISGEGEREDATIWGHDCKEFHYRFSPTKDRPLPSIFTAR